MIASTTTIGLSAAEVAESRARYGGNVLTPPKRESIWRKLAAKFQEPLIVILLVAGVMSVGIAFYNYWGNTPDHGDSAVFLEPVGIFIAILLATVIAFYFEVKAEKEFSVLNQVSDDEPVQVIRATLGDDGVLRGNTTTIPRRDVVVGDIIILSTGDEVPADAVLLEAVSLHVDESSLTGEPVAEKYVISEDAGAEGTTSNAAQNDGETFPVNHVMRGTKVMEGHVVARVFAVGDATENGRVFEAAQIDNSVKTPLDEQLERLALVITRISYVIAIVLIVGRSGVFLINNGATDLLALFQNFLESFMLAVALIVCAVPEGLPMAVSLCLALSMRRMMKTNNLVRRMHACETMGATTVICTDKTGTLTQNRMQVVDATSTIPAELIAACSTARLDFSADTPVAVGNPTEGALLLWLWQQGIDYRPLRTAVEVIDEEPFTTERKYMSVTIRQSDGRVVRYVKGAPEIVFAMCAESSMTHDEFTAQVTEFQRRGMRTLAFAASVTMETADAANMHDAPITFLGVVAIADPIRDDVPAAIKTSHDAGIRVIIVTGDSQATATEIGRQIGITSPDDIIARARPLDKRDLVERLQKEGHVVAVTGDGTNDAPALNAAHVGLSMGDGTSVAKEASDITILDNSFASITRAVMWGRSLYRNIQRFVLFQMTVCVIACTVVLVGAFTGKDSPLGVTQMLWVNLIMDTFAAMALASLPPSEAVMKEQPRSRRAFIITRPMWRAIIGGGLSLAMILTGALLCIEGSIALPMDTVQRFIVGLPEGYFFSLFVFVQFWNLFNAGAFATGRSALHLFRAHGFVGIASVILLGQLLIVTFGGQMFSVAPLTPFEWFVCFVVTSPVLWVGEILRLGQRR